MKFIFNIFDWMPKHWVVHRDLLGSDAIIVTAMFVHLIEGIVFLSTNEADWPIGMHAVLAAVHHNHFLAGTVLITACVLAAAGEWGNGAVVPGLRVCLLMTQFILLCITFFGADIAVYSGQFPCATLECIEPLSMPRVGIFCDQIPRFFWPGLYLVAVWARVRYK